MRGPLRVKCRSHPLEAPTDAAVDSACRRRRRNQVVWCCADSTRFSPGGALQRQPCAGCVAAAGLF
jgi:hypothetical protein